jgi:hypothetical protein
MCVEEMKPCRFVKSVWGEQALDFQARTQEFEIMCKEMESFLYNLC